MFVFQETSEVGKAGKYVRLCFEDMVRKCLPHYLSFSQKYPPKPQTVVSTDGGTSEAKRQKVVDDPLQHISWLLICQCVHIVLVWGQVLHQLIVNVAEPTHGRTSNHLHLVKSVDLLRGCPWSKTEVARVLKSEAESGCPCRSFPIVEICGVSPW